MDKANALGFWAKHPLVMDALYDLDDLHVGLDCAEGLPPELVTLVKNNRVVLSDLIEAAEKDVDAFGRLYDKLRETLEPWANIPKKKQAWDWDHKILVKPRDGSNAKAKPIEFGWDWLTEMRSQSEKGKVSTMRGVMYIQTWVWMKGGRFSEKLLFTHLKKLAPALDAMTTAEELRGENWASGAVLLDRINVSDRVKDDFSLDLDSLVNDVWKSFEWITEAKLSTLFSL